jgi:hypothetical protein
VKALILTLIVGGSLAGFTPAQSVRSQGLVLTGSLVSVTPKINPDAKKPLFLYNLRLYLQLRNDANVPLFVIDLKGNIVARRIEFQESFDARTETGDISTRPSPWIVPYTVDSFYKNIKAENLLWPITSFLSSRYAKPPGNGLIVLEPGSYFEFIEEITVDDGFSLEIKPRQGLQEVARNPPIPEYPGFRIEFRLSLKTHHPDDALFVNAQQRWKQFGHLVVDRNGDFSVRSELIVNRPGN